MKAPELEKLSSPIPAAAPAASDAGLEALMRTVGRFFQALRLLIVVVLAVSLFGGAFYVKVDQQAMLFRFGKLVIKDGQEILRSGDWYWAWPYPVDEVRKIPAQRSVTLTTRQFAPKLDPNRLENKESAPPPPEDQPLRPGQDGYLLTGDANIMHTVWTLTYRVRDARRYYLAFADNPATATGPGGGPVAKEGVDFLIQCLLEDAAVAEVGAWPVEDVFRPGAAKGGEAGARGVSLNNAVKERVIRALETLDVGIEVQQVSLVEVQPPASVQATFRNVLNAATDRQTEIDKARAYENKVITEAEGRKTKVLSDARAYQTRTVAGIRAAADYFETVLSEYEKNPDTMLVSLHADAVREALGRAEARYVTHVRDGGEQEVRLLLGPEPPRKKTPEAGGQP